MAKKAAKASKVTKANIVEPKGVAMVPSDSKQIASDIDMKLSKQDIIDMMLEEAKEKLQKEVDEKRATYEDLQFQFQSLNRHGDGLKPYIEKLKASVETQYAKELAIISLHGKLTLEVENHGYRSLILVAGKGIMSNDAYNTAMNNISNVPPSARHNKISGHVILLPIAVQAFNDGKKQSSTSPVSISMSLPINEKEAKAIYADLETLAKDFGAAATAYEEARSNLQSLDGSAKKAKAQLVRNILESSGDGQSVLAGLGGMKQALIAQITKK